MRLLIICTGNTCRSQMAEGFLRSFDPSIEVFSAGTQAEEKVNPYAVKAMMEVGVDIRNQFPEPITKYLSSSFDYVITVCDGAKEICPVFTGKVRKRLHIGFEDPAAVKGPEEKVMPVYRKVRDEIKKTFFDLYESINSEKV